MALSLHTERYKQFCEMLIRKRKDAGVSQEQLAKRLAKPQSFISKYERAERRIDVVEFLELARAIGFDPAEFLIKFSDVEEGQPQ